MSGLYQLFCLLFSVGWAMAAKCPVSPPITQVVDYEQIKGPWFLAASNPEFDEKCKNLTFSEGRHRFQLREQLFDSADNWKSVTNNYVIEKRENSPIIRLENVETRAIVNLFLIDGDYKNYIIFYSCDDSSGSASEAWEIWSRGKLYEASSLLPRIANTLSRLNLKPTDFSYTTTADCAH